MVFKQYVEGNALVSQVLDELQAEITDRKVEIVVGNLPSFLADPALLKQVFYNLL